MNSVRRWLGVKTVPQDYIATKQVLAHDAARPNLDSASSTAASVTEESASVADSAASLTGGIGDGGNKRQRPKSRVLRSLSSAVQAPPVVDGGNVRRITVSSFHRRVQDLGKFEVRLTTAISLLMQISLGCRVCCDTPSPELLSCCTSAQSSGMEMRMFRFGASWSISACLHAAATITMHCAGHDVARDDKDRRRIPVQQGCVHGAG